MRYLSLCSGIEAASVAWKPLGWQPVAFAEIEKFPSAVLAHHYPGVPNLGDITKFQEWPDLEPVDLICGGTPCQSFSVAGLRKGVADPRGNLALTFLAIVDRYRPCYVLWENVPGVLSTTSHDAPDPCPPPPPVDLGRDGAELETEDKYDSEELHAFNSFLAGLSELGYGVCARVLDAQYARVDGFPRAVPQRRNRVFVVGCLGDWRRAAAVLSEPESVLGDTPPRREAGERVASATGGSVVGSLCARDSKTVGNQFFNEGKVFASTGSVAHCLNAGAMGRIDYDGGLIASTDYESETMVATRSVAATLTRGAESQGKGGYAGRRQEDDDNLVAHSLRAEGFDASEDGTGRGTPLIPVAFNGRMDPVPGEIPGAVDTDAFTQCVAFTQNSRSEVRLIGGEGEITGAVTSEPGAQCQNYVSQGWAVRRLTPTECEALQGFPAGYTLIPFGSRKKIEAAELLYLRMTRPELTMEEARRLASDGPRYKALGNSWAVNVARWIGLRIEMVEAIAGEQIAEAAE